MSIKIGAVGPQKVRVRCRTHSSGQVLPILVAIPVLFGLIIFGEFRLYLWIANQFGWLAGVASVSATLLLACLMIMAAVRRYQRIHGKTVNRRRILTLSGPWGELTLDANEKRGDLVLQGKTASFIFADITDVQTSVIDGQALLRLQLAHTVTDNWAIPMENVAQSRRWHKILRYAALQRL